jgi:hypothetical protein
MLFPSVYTYLQEKKKEGLPPDFLWSLLALANLMRLSLLKAAHAVMSGAVYRKSGLCPSCSTHVRESANMGHPSRELGLVGNRESGGRIDSQSPEESSTLFGLLMAQSADRIYT